jgi:hypothetical protein
MENDSLKKLKTNDNKIIEGLNSNNMKFKLEVFDGRRFGGVNESFEFLSAHMSTLKVTSCYFETDRLTFLMANFPQLHTLTLDCYVNFEKHPNYPFNATIRNVKINVTYYDVLCMGFDSPIIDFIQKLQNLQHIEITYINSGILQALYNCRTLKTVIYSQSFYDPGLTQRDLDEMELHDNIEFFEIPIEE